MDQDALANRDGAALEEKLQLRPGRLRELLDAEFTRSTRFEGLSTLLGDLRGFLRSVIKRDDEVVGAHNLFPTDEEKTPR